MIRTVQLSEITENIKEMCIEANHFLSPDMAEAMKQAEAGVVQISEVVQSNSATAEESGYQL